MRIEFVEKLDLSLPGELLAIPVLQDHVLDNPFVSELDRMFEGLLGRLAGEEKFKGKPAQSLAFNTLGKAGFRRVLLLGLGTEEKTSADTFRRAGGRVTDWLRKYGVGEATLLCQLTENAGFSWRQAAGALIEGLILGLYRFDKYKSRENGEPVYKGPEKVGIFTSDAGGKRLGERNEFEEEARHALVVTEGVTAARWSTRFLK